MGSQRNPTEPWPVTLRNYFNFNMQQPNSVEMFLNDECQRLMHRCIFLIFYALLPDLFSQLIRPTPLQMFVLFYEEMEINSSSYDFLTPFFQFNPPDPYEECESDEQDETEDRPITEYDETEEMEIIPMYQEDQDQDEMETDPQPGGGNPPTNPR